ncbi:hypothetical protein JCM19239_2567 [Vibrio variabilis]|uniref:Uncharacterized protein n=1 Tax=Vibrio variabilis TaxID=990271 RepID=A0ABQ0JR45_9VIBR|nr:hypothetical protein JCM19239_2567 [Vibrio variabilis]
MRMNKQKLLKENGLNVAFSALVVAIVLKTAIYGWGQCFSFIGFSQFGSLLQYSTLSLITGLTTEKGN